MTFNASGYIAGVATAVGSFNFAYKVVDNAGASVSTNGRLRVFANGDWNGDGVVDKRDAAFLMLILNGDD